MVNVKMRPQIWPSFQSFFASDQVSDTNPGSQGLVVLAMSAVHRHGINIKRTFVKVKRQPHFFSTSTR